MGLPEFPGRLLLRTIAATLRVCCRDALVPFADYTTDIQIGDKLTRSAAY